MAIAGYCLHPDPGYEEVADLKEKGGGEACSRDQRVDALETVGVCMTSFPHKGTEVSKGNGTLLCPSEPLLDLRVVKLMREGVAEGEFPLSKGEKDAGGGYKGSGSEVGQQGQRARPLSLRLPPLGPAPSEWPEPP